jgi:glycosyltransferase involved in cell wall biosynthesis
MSSDLKTVHEKTPASKSLGDLRIAFYVYPTAFQSPGGGEIQLLKTKEHLEKLGAKIKLLDTWNDKLKDFDILHVFGSVKDCLPIMLAAKNAGIKVVLSTICWYSWKSALGTYGSRTQRALAFARHFAKAYLPFIPSKRKTMIQISDALLPNSQSEAGQLMSFFGASRDKITVVPNGVEPSFAEANPDAFTAKFKLKDFILCVGRIEPRKNQLNMIRALKDSPYPLVFVGQVVPHHKNYYDLCRKEAGANVHFLDAFEHGSPLLASAYAACNTFLLASWLETPGLAALEAALAGAKIVITEEGATREYFQQFALYAAPNNLSDIRQKTIQAFASSPVPALKKHILENYLWRNTAEKTAEVYLSLMGGPRG